MARLRSPGLDMPPGGSTDQWLDPSQIQTMPVLGQVPLPVSPKDPGGVVGPTQPTTTPTWGTNPPPGGGTAPLPNTDLNGNPVGGYYMPALGETINQALAKQGATSPTTSPTNPNSPAPGLNQTAVSYDPNAWGAVSSLTSNPNQWIGGYLQSIKSSDDPQQWQQYYNQWGYKDPNYFLQRIQMASGGPKAGQDPSSLGAQPGGGGSQGVPTTPAGTIDFSSILNGLTSKPIIPSSGTGSQVPIDTSGLNNALMGLINNGGNFNTNIVNQRAEAARTNLGIEQAQQQQNDMSSLAARGLANSGPVLTAQNRLDQTVGQQYQSALENIIANESQNADNRMLTALQMAGNLAGGNVNDLINQYATQAQTGLNLGGLVNNNTLGLGSLALGNLNSANNYNLGVAQVGAQADAAQASQYQNLISELILLMNQQGQLANTSTQGFT